MILCKHSQVKQRNYRGRVQTRNETRSAKEKIKHWTQGQAIRTLQAGKGSEITGSGKTAECLLRKITKLLRFLPSVMCLPSRTISKTSKRN